MSKSFFENPGNFNTLPKCLNTQTDILSFLQDSTYSFESEENNKKKAEWVFKYLASYQEYNPLFLSLISEIGEFKNVLQQYQDLKNCLKESKNQLTEISLSTLPEPEIYKGWGFKFKQEGIEVKEEDGKNYLVITIDDVFDGSKLKEMGLEKGDKIKIELGAILAESLSADGKFDVGKVSQFVRSAETITAITKEDTKLQLNDKMVFVKVGDKHINFEDLINKEEENEGDKKKLEKAVKKAFENAKDAFKKLPPAPAPQQPERKDFEDVRQI